MKRATIGLTLFLLVTSTWAQTLPTGTYTTTITKADAADRFVGKWEITLDDKNRFTVHKNGELMVEGRSTFTANQWTLTDEKGRLACTGAEISGTYKWNFDGKTLTLTTVEDKCGGRNTILTQPMELSTPVPTAVSPKGKLATTWAKIKQGR